MLSREDVYLVLLLFMKISLLIVEEIQRSIKELLTFDLFGCEEKIIIDIII